MSRSHEKPVYPSTVHPSLRSQIASEDPIEYNRLYQEISPSVHERLFADATQRTARSMNTHPFYPAFYAAPPHPGSGYTRNMVKTTVASKQLPDPAPEDLPLRYLQESKMKNPVDFFCTIRPGTKSMYNTMKMLGTHNTDPNFYAATATALPLEMNERWRQTGQL